MATLISDLYGADPSPFHHARAASTHQQPQPPQQQHDRSMVAPHATSAHAIPLSHPASPPLSSSNSFSSPPQLQAQSQSQAQSQIQPRLASADKSISNSVSDGSERIPTPPDSSTPTSPNTHRHRQQHSSQASPGDAPAASRGAMSSDASVQVQVQHQHQHQHQLQHQHHRQNQRQVQVAVPVQDEPREQRTIMIRDLAHIQTLTQPDHTLRLGVDSDGGGLLAGDAPLQDIKFDISAMPIGDIIEMVAALLTKITTTNDHQHDALHRNATHSRQAQAHNAGSGGEAVPSSGHSPHSASVLAFHGKNVPAITILSYLSRIHKYCPTTYEVFLSLLVYFDRMTERVNDLVMKQQPIYPATVSTAPTPAPTPAAATAAVAAEMPTPAATDDVVMSDASDEGDGATVVVEEMDETDETDENIADSSSDSSSDDGDDASQSAATTRSVAPNASVPNVSSSSSVSRTASPHLSTATYFVVDSYNIHRLIIAGVTCASKFFSDVFYTNARYAKVGGLPLAELNHLELQFLILNDFRLAIPIDDLDAYATMLVEFYAREVVGQRPRPSV